MELIDVLTSILVAFGRLTVDWGMIEINDALDKGYLNANNVRIVTKEATGEKGSK